MSQTRDFESISAFFVKSTIHDDGSENQRNPDQKSEQKMLKKQRLDPNEKYNDKISWIQIIRKNKQGSIL